MIFCITNDVYKLKAQLNEVFEPQAQAKTQAQSIRP